MTRKNNKIVITFFVHVNGDILVIDTENVIKNKKLYGPWC